MVGFWVVLAAIVVALCFKRTHAALTMAAVLAFFVGVHCGVSRVGPAIDSFVASIPRSVSGP